MDEAGKCFQIKGTGGAKAQRQECQEPIIPHCREKQVRLQGGFKRHATETDFLL